MHIVNICSISPHKYKSQVTLTILVAVMHTWMKVHNMDDCIQSYYINKIPYPVMCKTGLTTTHTLPQEFLNILYIYIVRVHVIHPFSAFNHYNHDFKYYKPFKLYVQCDKQLQLFPLHVLYSKQLFTK